MRILLILKKCLVYLEKKREKYSLALLFLEIIKARPHQH